MKRQKTLWYSAAALSVFGSCCFAVSGMRFSGILLWCGAVFLIALALLDRLSSDKPWARWSRNALLFLFCAGTVFFLVLETKVVLGAAGSADGPVIVLGAGVDGTEPSLMLSRRLDAALDYAAPFPDVPFIVTGCQGEGELISEAECMRRYLNAHGVGDERIFPEEQATSTLTNLRFSLAILEELGLGADAPFAVVTSAFHIARVRYLAGTLGVPPERMLTVGAELPGGLYYDALTMNYYIREAFALANELLLGVDADI